MNAPVPTFLIPEFPNRRSSVFLSEDDRIASPLEILSSRSTSGFDVEANPKGGRPVYDSYISRSQIPQRRFAPPVVLGIRQIAESADAAVIQVWEGKVLRVDHKRAVMEVSLEAKIGNIPPHAAEIELQWVTDQDRDLVEPGAIFYLTLFKRTKRGSIENTQELRFRRLPAWTRQQVAQVHEDAAHLLTKMKAKPQAE
jgi:hypothetical protein